jgi:ankyrin repeat protein
LLRESDKRAFSEQIDVNERKNNNGATALFLAAKRGFLEIVVFLRSKGASIDIECNVGENKSLTPLHIAAKNGHLEVVKYLIHHSKHKETILLQ